MIFRSDNGGEFLGHRFVKVCNDEGITMEESEPDVHHQNGVIEREHRTITESARAALLQTQLPHYLWEYAIRKIVFARNRVLNKREPTKTPFEVFWGRRPDLKNVRAFGQRCVALIPDEKRSTTYKFRPKGRTGVWKVILRGKDTLCTSLDEVTRSFIVAASSFSSHQAICRHRVTMTRTPCVLAVTVSLRMMVTTTTT